MTNPFDIDILILHIRPYVASGTCILPIRTVEQELNQGRRRQQQPKENIHTQIPV